MIRKFMLIVAGFVSASLGLRAQALTEEQKINSMQAIYSLLETYINYSALSEPGVEGISELSQTKLEGILHPDSLIFDDITPTQLDGIASPDGLILGGSNKKFGQMVADYKRHFPYGLNIRVVSVAFHLRSLSQRSATIYLVREVNGRYDDKWILANKNSRLEIQIELSEDFRSARIVRLTQVGQSNILCKNCPQPEPVAMVNRSHSDQVKSNKKPISPIPTQKASRLFAFFQAGVGITPKLGSDADPLLKNSQSGLAVQGNVGIEYRIHENKGSALLFGLVWGENRWSGERVGQEDSVTNAFVVDGRVKSLTIERDIQDTFSITNRYTGAFVGYKHYFPPAARVSFFAEGGIYMLIAPECRYESNAGNDSIAAYDIKNGTMWYDFNQKLKTNYAYEYVKYPFVVNPFIGAGLGYQMGQRLRLNAGMRLLWHSLKAPDTNDKPEVKYDEYLNPIITKLHEYRKPADLTVQLGLAYRISQ